MKQILSKGRRPKPPVQESLSVLQAGISPIAMVGTTPLVAIPDLKTSDEVSAFDKLVFVRQPGWKYFLRRCLTVEFPMFPSGAGRNFYVLVNRTSPNCRLKGVISRSTGAEWDTDHLALIDEAKRILATQAATLVSMIDEVPYE
jgi:hypothetical protein